MYGRHAVTAALHNPKRAIERIHVTKAQLVDMQAEIRKTGPRGAKLLDKMQVADASFFSQTFADDAVHQGIAALVHPLPATTLEHLEGPCVVVLDQVTDPHNIGAILRSAAAFGACAVVVTREHSAGESGVMAKAASGTLERIPLVPVVNLAQALATLKERGYWCLGLDAAGEKAIHEAPDFAKVALVMGAEGKGLRRLTAEHCDVLVRLPMESGVESLNVSNATAVALYALYQQRK